jgi:hypothetical protein
MRIFTKVNGELVVYETNTEDINLALKMVKDELGPEHKVPVLALVKY